MRKGLTDLKQALRTVVRFESPRRVVCTMSDDVVGSVFLVYDEDICKCTHSRQTIVDTFHKNAPHTEYTLKSTNRTFSVHHTFPLPRFHPPHRSLRFDRDVFFRTVSSLLFPTKTRKTRKQTNNDNDNERPLRYAQTVP